MKPIKPEFQRELDKKIRLEFNYNSNHLEGNTLTYGETKLLLFFDKTTGNHEMREYEEMKSHDLAFELVKEWATDKERPLTERAIKELHELLLVRPFWKEALTPDGQQTRRIIKVGDYKEFPNSVRLQNGEIFEYASPKDTPILMGELVQWYRNEETKKEHHPVVLAALLHYKFVCIHPFDDGNGRLARLLLNYVLLRHDLPPIIIKSADKKNYLFALNQADTGDLNSFVKYIANQLFWSLDIFIKAAQGESIDEKEDLDKKIAILEKELEVIDPEAEVKIHLNRDVFLRILKSWLGNLLESSISVVQKFNKFFTSTNHFISPGNLANIIFANEPPSEIINILIYECELNSDRLDRNNIDVSLNTFYGTLKKGGLNTFGCNYSIRVKFDQIKYEVYVDDFTEEGAPPKTTKLYERLLHQPLHQAELEAAANHLGDTIYQHIDFTSKERGLR